MTALRLTLGERRRVRVALIPAAGHSVGLFPMTKVLTSAMLPVLDQDGITKPAILVQVGPTAGLHSVLPLRLASASSIGEIRPYVASKWQRGVTAPPASKGLHRAS
jgi:hypothetical protein